MPKRFFKIYQWVLLLGLLAVFIPLAVAGFFNRPTGDDLSQPYGNMLILQNGGSLWDVVKATLRFVYHDYFAMEGVFSFLFLTQVPPMIFDYRLGFVHPILFMLALIGAIFRAVYCVRAYKPDVPKELLNCAALLLSTMILLMVPTVAFSLYWFAGACYTLSFSIVLFLCASLFSLYLRNRGEKPGLACVLLLCPAFFLAGGCDFINVTVAVLLAGFFALHVLCAKKHWLYLLPCLFLLAGYCAAVLAPGNFIRKEDMGFSASMVYVFARSFQVAFQQLFGDGKVWVFALLFLPVAVELSRRLPLTYRHYLLVPLLSFAVQAAAAFPALYGTDDPEMLRIVNMWHYIKCCLICVNLVYLAGVVRKALSLRSVPDAKNARWRGPMPYLYVVIVTLLFAGVSVPNLSLKPLRLNCDLAPVKAVSLFLDGSLQEYARQYDENVAIARAHPGEDITVPYNPWVPILDSLYLEESPQCGTNIRFAAYYGCRSVSFDPSLAE